MIHLFWLISLICVSTLVFHCNVSSDEITVIDDKKYVEIRVEAKVDSLTKGAGGVVTVDLKPMKGVKLNKIPPLHIVVEGAGILTLDKKEVTLPGKKEMKKLDDLFMDALMDPKADMSQFYFPELKPFLFPFTLTRKPSSKTQVKVKIAYTYCTIKDGFCAPREKKFNVPLTMKKSK